MEPTAKIPARLALLLARNLATRREVALILGRQQELSMPGEWMNELINAVADQCTTEEFEAAAVAVKLEEGTYQMPNQARQ